MKLKFCMALGTTAAIALSSIAPVSAQIQGGPFDVNVGETIVIYSDQANPTWSVKDGQVVSVTDLGNSSAQLTGLSAERDSTLVWDGHGNQILVRVHGSGSSPNPDPPVSPNPGPPPSSSNKVTPSQTPTDPQDSDVLK